jgi:hypothetical protein
MDLRIAVAGAEALVRAGGPTSTVSRVGATRQSMTIYDFFIIAVLAKGALGTMRAVSLGSR